MNSIAQYFAEWEDRRLVRHFLQRREERAFREIYRRHGGRLYLLAMRLAGREPRQSLELGSLVPKTS